MTMPFIPALELAALVVTAWTTLAVVLVFRHPRLPFPLKSEAAAQAITLILVAALTVASTFAMSGLIEARMSFQAAGSVAGAAVVLGFISGWVALGMSRRLRQADMGRSPFERIRVHSGPAGEPA